MKQLVEEAEALRDAAAILHRLVMLRHEEMDDDALETVVNAMDHLGKRLKEICEIAELKQLYARR